MLYLGIDLHRKQMTISLRNELGDVLLRRQVSTRRAKVEEFLEQMHQLGTGRYYCHKCRSRGNQLELWAAANKLSLYEAAVDLCRILGHEVPWIERR